MNFLKRLSNVMNTPLKDIEGYENLQKRINEKCAFLERVSSFFTDLNKHLIDFSKKIVTLNSNFTNITITLEEQNIYQIYKLIFQKIIFDLDNDNKLVDDILKNLNNHIKSFNDEKTYYEEFKKINKDLLDEKDRLEKNQKNYENVGKDVENKIKQFVQMNYDQLQNLPPETEQGLKSIVSLSEKPTDTYNLSIEKVNQLVSKFNQKQKLLLEYLPELGSQDGAIFFRTITIYLKSLEIAENILNSNRKQVNSSKSIETDSALKELLEINSNNKVDQKKVEFIHYKTDLDFNKCLDLNQFNIYTKTIETINKYSNKEIFTNYNYEEELRKFEVGQTIRKLYEIKGDIDEKLAEKFLDSLKDITVHKTVYIVLSQLRTNNRFKQSKTLITLLGKGFNILLDEAEKIESYDNAKNCVILSQTYYYDDENDKKKVYLFQFIKHHKWLNDPNFWRKFIDTMIKKEFERFQSNYMDGTINLEEEKNITKKVKDKLGEVIFSQLLPFTSNMLDLDMDKRIVLKIVDEFIEKYNYISQGSKESIFGLISNDQSEIEKYRKEYNPSLETQTKNQDVEDKKEENKEKNENTDAKNEPKEENKEKNENIDAKNEPKEENKEKNEKKDDKNEPKEESKEKNENSDDKNETKEEKNDKEESSETKKDENNA